MDQPDRLDEQWISQLVRTHQHELISYALHLTTSRDADTARDLVQETFCRLCDQSASDRQRIAEHIKPWLFTVCRNLAFQSHRKARRMKPITEGQLLSRPAAGPTPAEHAEASDTLQQMLRAVDELSASQQEVLRLKFHHNLSYMQIADVTGHTVSNVGYLIHAGLTRLRSQLADNDAAPLAHR